MLDLTAATQAMFARVLSDSEGAAARATLGSIIPADKLKSYADAGNLPNRVIAAFRARAITGNARDGQRLLFHWWLYDDVRYQYARINAAIPLIVAAYPDEEPIGALYIVCNGASEERPDAALFQMPARSITFTVHTRQ